MRTKIREAIRRALNSASGYENLDFRTGFAPYINEGGYSLPCAWLCPLELIEKSGRKEGWKTYAGVMYIMEPIDGLSPEEKDAAWDRMEMVAEKTFAAAMESGDISIVENIKCAPDEYALSGFGTVSIAVNFDVKMKYCENRG